MSALAEALVAAQRRALAAVEKQYAAGKLAPSAVREKLTAIGLTDDVDADRLIAALDLIREYGAPLPAEPTNGVPSKQAEPASDAQLAYVAKLVADAKVQGPDLPLTKDQAHEVIDSLKAGTARREADACDRDGYDVTAALLRQLAEAVEGKSHAD